MNFRPARFRPIASACPQNRDLRRDESVSAHPAWGQPSSVLRVRGRVLCSRLPCAPTCVADYSPGGADRFYFFAGDRAEPPHVHVEGDDGEAKYWLRPVAQVDAWGYSARELRVIERIIEAHRDEFLRAWDDFIRG